MIPLRQRVVRLAGVALAAVGIPLGASAQPSYSSPIALAPDESVLWVVNPTDDSVSVIDTATNTVLDEIDVGDEPRSIAIDPDNRYAFVANAAGNSVTVLRILEEDPEDFEAVPDDRINATGELITGAEPWSVVVTPDGKRAFVANAGQDTLTVIQVRPGAPRILGQKNLRQGICNADDPKRHFQPRGLAVTEDSERLFVGRFFSFTKRQNGQQGNDDGKEGVVCALLIDTSSTNLADYQLWRRIKLASQETGFAFTPPDGFPARAYPNQLQSLVIRGDKLYLPNIAASPSAPLRFNLDTQAFVNVIDGVVSSNQPRDQGALNLHLGARDPEPDVKRLFFANPWAIAFTNQSGLGDAYVVSAASDLLVKLNVDNDGDLGFTVDGDTTTYIDLNDPDDVDTSGGNAGKNPRGIVINALDHDGFDAGTRAYVTNHLSRNVSVVDLTIDEVVQVIPTIDLPPPGTVEETLTVGAEVFFSSRGNFDGGKVDRLSSEGWQACSSCHFEGLTDSVVWVFGAGPRKSVQLNATFNPDNPDEQRILNYSAIFDEVEDFELNIRNVSGPGPLNGANDPNHGLLIGDDGNINGAPAVIAAFLPIANAGRPQLTVTLPGSNVAVPALEALREWVRFAVRTPNGPLDRSEVRGGVNRNVLTQGRNLFGQAGCDECHGGSHWTTSLKEFASPPEAGDVATEIDPAPEFGNPIGVQYLADFLEEVGSFNLGVRGEDNPIGRNVGAEEFANAAPVDGQLNLPDALGIDYNADGKGDGYNVPSLLGIHNVQPYLHNGACETIACVLLSRAHRTAGEPTDFLNTGAKRNKVAKFVESIDTETPPFD